MTPQNVVGAIVKHHVAALGGDVLTETYVPPGSNRVTDIVDKVRRIKPDVILNTINGDNTIHFFRGLRAAGVTPESAPTMSFRISETELQSMNNSAMMVGDFTEWNYFQCIGAPAVSADVGDVRRLIDRQRLPSPKRAVYIGKDTRHTWTVVNIGRICSDGRFDIEWSSAKPVPPVHCPDCRTQEVWDVFLAGLYTGWGNLWTRPKT